MSSLITIDRISAVPRHRQVYDAIRHTILSGRLRPGDRLPATRALAGELSLSRTTVAEAYAQLGAEGYIQGKHGSGTYVAPDLPDDSVRVEQSAPQRALANRSARLSVLGRLLVVDESDVDAATNKIPPWRYDFRPHRIAEDFFPWDAWRASVDHVLSTDREGLLLYPPVAGHPALREAIAAHIARFRAVVCSPDQVIIVNGTLQGLNLLAQLTLDQGNRVAVEDPGYPAARLLFASRGMRVSRLPVDGEGMVVENLARLEPHRLIHVTPSHQYPTGATLSLGRRLALLDVAARTGCLVIEDDYDSEFRYEGRPVESLQGLDRGGLVVYAGTFSKSLLAGLRLGFLVLPQSLVGPLLAAKSLWDGGAPMLEQSALAQFLRCGDFERHIRRMRRLYRRRRDALVTSLADVFGKGAKLGAHHSGLNLLISLDLPISDGEFVRRAAAAGIGLRAASPYYADPPARPTFLLGFAALTEEEIRMGIKALAQI